MNLLKQAYNLFGGGSEAPSTSTPPTTSSIRLYQYLQLRGKALLDLVTETDSIDYYNANDDSHRYTDREDWHFAVADKLDVPISLDNDMLLDPTQRRATFATMDQGVQVLVFPHDASFTHFRSKYTSHLHDNLPKNETYMELDEDAMDVDTEDYYEQEAPRPPPEEHVQPAAGGAGGGGRGGRGEEEEEEVDGLSYSLLEMGIGDYSYAVRGNVLDMYKNEVGGMKKMTNEVVIKGRGGGGGGVDEGGFTPSKVMLTNAERNMLLLSPSESSRSSIYQLDLERASVVQSWRFQKDDTDIPMLAIEHENKGGSMDVGQTFLGLDRRRIVRWDMRTREGEVQELVGRTRGGGRRQQEEEEGGGGGDHIVSYSSGRDYSQKEDFTCIKTTGAGWVVVGDKRGTLRFFNKVGGTARTALPGMGAPITAVDVTFDGNWVLATTDRFLMLVKTSFRDKSGEVESAFKKSMLGKEAKMARPICLKLRTEHGVLVSHAPLTNGRFEWKTEGNSKESWLVASCGKYTLAWNFATLRSKHDKGGGGGGEVNAAGLPVSTDYQMWEKDEKVVDSQFVHEKYYGKNGTAPLVVMSEHAVYGAEQEEED